MQSGYVIFFVTLRQKSRIAMDGSTRNRWQMVGISAVLHFLVDGLCLCCLYLLMNASFEMLHFFGFFVIYNVLAFLTQPLTGWWADVMKHRHWMLLLSVVFLTIGVLTVSLLNAPLAIDRPVLSVVASIFLGIGNSLFHVWGGKQVAIRTNNDIRALGVFVSTGVFGLAVSMVFFSWTLLYVLLLAICLLAVFYIRLADNDERLAIKVENLELKGGTLLLLIMAFVMFRSFVGESFSAAIVKDNMVILLIGLSAMLGKMAGGWLACRFGVVVTLIVVLTEALGCLLCRSTERYVLLTGLFAINCTMPVTLYWANNLLKGREGLAFGLLAAALIPGYLLTILSSS